MSCSALTFDGRNAVYDACGKPLWDGLPHYDGAGGIIHTRPICHFLCSEDRLATCHEEVERAWFLPLDRSPLPVPPDVLGELVTVLDKGLTVALFAADETAIADAGGAILTMAGGGHG